MSDDHTEEGFLAFPYLKLRVLSARKGSALFWYTLKQSGRDEFGARFTSCPVTVGSKWIAFKTMYEKGQEFRQPCNKRDSFGSSIRDYYNDFF
jgi:prolyl 4-hydroxylase